MSRVDIVLWVVDLDCFRAKVDLNDVSAEEVITDNTKDRLPDDGLLIVNWQNKGALERPVDPAQTKGDVACDRDLCFSLAYSKMARSPISFSFRPRSTARVLLMTETPAPESMMNLSGPEPLIVI